MSMQLKFNEIISHLLWTDDDLLLSILMPKIKFKI